MRGEESVTVAAPPEVVWALVADVTRMGEWSPECRRCEWLDGATGPSVGARFRGHNRIAIYRWTRVCRVTAADPGVEFAFVTLGPRGEEETHWRYRFRPAAGGTEVTESFEGTDRPGYVETFYRVPGGERTRIRQVHAGMRRTLERIKATAES
jgi:hypothetical protein